jgi:hypothetical protein
MPATSVRSGVIGGYIGKSYSPETQGTWADKLAQYRKR